MRRPCAKTVAAAACLTVLVGTAGQGSAADAAPPAPSLRITTTVGPQALPVSGMHGAWAVSKPGASAQLRLSGTVVTGTVTQVTASWMSSWIEAQPRSSRWPRLHISVEDEHDSVLPGPEDNHWSAVVSYRTSAKRGWSVFVAADLDDPFDLLFNTVKGFDGVGWLRAKRVQFRVTLRATLDDTSNADFTARVEASS